MERTSFAVREHLNGPALVVAASLAQWSKVSQQGRVFLVVKHESVETLVAAQWSSCVTAAQTDGQVA